MGLASALAAQQQNNGGGGGGGYTASSMPATQPLPQQQFPSATAAPAAPPPAAVSTAGMESVIAARLQHIVQSNSLASFYPPAALSALASRIAAAVDFRALAARWRMPVELAVDLSSLALYDIVIYADDSGSMESGEGERIEDLKLIVAKVAEVATLFDEDGIEVRFINAETQGSHIKTADEVNRLISSVSYTWDTKIATQLEAKILRPMAYNTAQMRKPLLVITVTDGEPTDTPKDKIAKVIKECSKRMVSAGRGPHAVAFQFAQVGRDQRAQEFLAELDNHPKVGSLIDCTSYFELEQAEYAKKGVSLSVEAWLVKLMTGAIDKQLDGQDESTVMQQGASGHNKKPKKSLLAKLFG